MISECRNSVLVLSKVLFSSSSPLGLGGFDSSRLSEAVRIGGEINGTPTLTFLATAFLLETFFGFPAVILLVVVVFFEETLGVAVFFEETTAIPLTMMVSVVMAVFVVTVVVIVVTVL